MLRNGVKLGDTRMPSRHWGCFVQASCGLGHVWLVEGVDLRAFCDRGRWRFPSSVQGLL